MSVELTKEPNGPDGTENDTKTAPGAPASARISWAPIPRVNLLPIEIIEGRRFRRTQGLLGATVVGVLVLAGAGTYVAQRGVAAADEQLVAAQARVSTQQAEKARFASVPKVIAEVDAANTARVLALGADVLWYRYLNDLDGARPNGVKLSGMTLALSAGPAAAGADPLTQAGIGTVTLEGTATRYGQVASWLEELNKITGLGSSSLTNAAKDEDVVTFSSGVVLTADALSGRYLKKAG
jgi:Tfp pilus assembly protein PilN